MNDELLTKKSLDEIMKMFVMFEKSEKRGYIIQLIKFMITTNIKTNQIYNTNFQMIYNKEMGEIDNLDVSLEDDFLEALYAYLLILQSSNTKIVKALCKEEIGNG